MIASPAANMYARDSWIGWRTEDLIKNIVSGEWESRQVARSLLGILREAIQNIRIDDLIKKSEIENPTIHTYFKLEQIIERSIRERAADLQSQNDGTHDQSRLIDIRDFKSKDPKTFTNKEWRKLSGTSLFVKKRAEQLLPLLKTLDYFKRADFETEPSSALMETLVSTEGRKHVSFALNEIRKLKLSSEIADISVCGAIAPYNQILGGKLVTLIMASQEIRDAYKDRYSNQPSEIASQIAGRKLIRNSELKVVTTTSLYGVGSSQYNRLKLPAKNHESLKNDIRWEELEMSEGFSVTHVSLKTVELMRKLAIKEYGRRRINSVFGEGSSPRTRQIRSGLNLIGISDEGPLRHAVGRRVYACELYPGARRTLIGLTGNSRKLRSQSIKNITTAWLERWVVQRIKRQETLDSISEFQPDNISENFKTRIKSVQLEDVATYELTG
ncbi:Druantia anti-phage system protein DruA [Litorimonas sp. RW-G-Af-16]